MESRRRLQTGGSLSDSERQELLKELNEKDALIESLKSSLESMRISLDMLSLTVKDLNKTNQNNQKQNEKLLSLVENLTKELETYKARMGRSNQETFGSKSLNRKHKAATKKTRTEEKEDWTSKDDDEKNPPSAPGVSTEGINQEKVTSENLGRRGPRPCKYNRMNAAKVIYLETTLEDAPKDMVLRASRRLKNIPERVMLNVQCLRLHFMKMKQAIYTSITVQQTLLIVDDLMIT